MNDPDVLTNLVNDYIELGSLSFLYRESSIEGRDQLYHIIENFVTKNYKRIELFISMYKD
jgi:hypothetical protein